MAQRTFFMLRSSSRRRQAQTMGNDRMQLRQRLMRPYISALAFSAIRSTHARHDQLSISRFTYPPPAALRSAVRPSAAGSLKFGPQIAKNLRAQRRSPAPPGISRDGGLDRRKRMYLWRTSMPRRSARHAIAVEAERPRTGPNFVLAVSPNCKKPVPWPC